ncbi:MAG: hypothetical protein RMI91_12645 [Gemmatales bacterium]|nr:hypothetical protein [Gemmatales bacterium]MDW7995491.1 hypothetical protein [Gemmatales bacterium]
MTARASRCQDFNPLFSFIGLGILCCLGLAGKAEAPSSKDRPAYLNPLDVQFLDNEHVQVDLTGVRETVTVALTTGQIVHRARWPRERPDSDPEAVKIHHEELRSLAAQLRPPGAGSIRAVWGRADSGWMVHTWPRFSLPATQLAQGWVFTSGLTHWTGQIGYLWETAVLDEPNNGFADPSDVVIAADGRRAYVASGGSDCVAVVDLTQFHRVASRVVSDTRNRALEPYLRTDDLSASRFLVIGRLPTQNNPRRLAISPDQRRLVVSNFLGDSLSVFDVVQLRLERHISLGGPQPDLIRRGQILFHSAKLSHLGQFSCASCHPGGGADGLNWDLPRDGIGNAKNTRVLWGSRSTAPYGWLGTSPTLADRILGTLRSMHRYEPSAEELTALVAYVSTLPPAPVAEVAPSERMAYERGRALFHTKAGCATCHPPPTYQDGLAHDVGTGKGQERRFDTPSLRGLRFSAPYLHDGRAATLEEVFTKHNGQRRHGQVHLLTPEELADLLLFLRTL